jgi:opacity protein-like surface antigen
MKGPVLALVPVLLVASGCASAPSVPAMPAWTPAETVAVPAASSAAFLADDDAPHTVRVPRPVDETPDIWPAQGLYVGGALISSQPLGDFDGESGLVGPTDIILIPDIDVGAGGGVYVSYRWHMNELMLMYSITEHDGEFSGSTREHDTTFYDLDINWRHYFWEHSAIQPYGLLGLGWARAKIDDGSTDQATGTIFQDAELQNGINVNVGAGVAIYTLPWVVLFGQGMYRFVRYESSDGIDGNFSSDVDGDGWNVQFGAAIRLLPPRK